MFAICLSYNSIIEQDIISQTPLLHLGLTLTGAPSAIGEPETCLRRDEGATDHAAEALRDPSTPAPQHALDRAPAQDRNIIGPLSPKYR